MACVHNGVQRLIHTSTVDSLGYNPKGVANEDWKNYNYKFYNYSNTKREGEEMVMSYNGKNGLEVVVLHPGSMLGPFDITLQFGRFVIHNARRYHHCHFLH